MIVVTIVMVGMGMAIIPMRMVFVAIMHVHFMMCPTLVADGIFVIRVVLINTTGTQSEQAASSGNNSHFQLHRNILFMSSVSLCLHTRP